MYTRAESLPQDRQYRNQGICSHWVLFSSQRYLQTPLRLTNQSAVTTVRTVRIGDLMHKTLLNDSFKLKDRPLFCGVYDTDDTVSFRVTGNCFLSYLLCIRFLLTSVATLLRDSVTESLSLARSVLIQATSLSNFFLVWLIQRSCFGSWISKDNRVVWSFNVPHIDSNPTTITLRYQTSQADPMVSFL